MFPVRAVGDHDVPAAVAYWMDQPVRSMLELPRFSSSTKSFVKLAPALPPAAKTWLTTSAEDAPCAPAAGTRAATRVAISASFMRCMWAAPFDELCVARRDNCLQARANV